ncbi:MAG: hypothetical protein ACPGR7_00710 [Flavobacteriaceae bacterium]
MIKRLILIVFVMISGVTFAQDESTWPRETKIGDQEITLYQPQLDSLTDNKLTGRLALSIKATDQTPLFGAMFFSAEILSDYDEDTVSLISINIKNIKFPPDSKNEEDINTLINQLTTKIEASTMTVPLSQIKANVDLSQQVKESSKDLSTEAPEIFVEKKPTMLVLIDGKPVFKTDEESGVSYLQNSMFFIAQNKDKYYLKGGSTWYESKEVLGSSWKKVGKAPKKIEKFSEDRVVKDTSTTKKIDAILVVDTPSELIVSEGDFEYEPVSNTQLLYVKNTESDVILDIDDQNHYVLINGRWYKSKTLKSDSWSFVKPDELPGTFKNIGQDSAISEVRVSIPGTEEAEEAIESQYVPQTAIVDRATATCEVHYDGDPKFKQIEGTEVAYAINTSSSVIEVNGKFYCVDQGIWFEAKKPKGPWKVSDKRPEEVASIPPSSPVYNVKYVYIYDSTPDVVYVGYTPGYFNSYVYNGVVVYGTGYYYNPWYGPYYYPRPVTYGFGVHYNPYTGWGFTFGVSYGWMTVSAFHSPYYWGPAGYRYGYRHGYYHGYNHGYYHGYNRGYANGYIKGRQQSNIYKTRPNGIQRSTYNRVNNSNLNRSTKPNNIYTDRNGNVYKRNNNGNWTRPNSNQSVNNRQNFNRSSFERSYQTRQMQPRTSRGAIRGGGGRRF